MKANGKVGLVAMKAGADFPLDCITDVLASTQPTDNEVTLDVDSPGPQGFVIYVISEGEKATFTADGCDSVLLMLAHGDLSYVPPAQDKLGSKKTRAVKEVTLREKTFLMSETFEMHGGYISSCEVGDEIDDSQFIVYAPIDNEVKVTAMCKGKVGLLALRASKDFPLITINDILAYSEP